jgi:hypothetical protein
MIEKIRIPKNHVLVEVGFLRHKKIAFQSGTEIIVDPSFVKEQHAKTNGIVKAIPEALYFNPLDPMQSSEYLTNINVKVGDEVFFHYLQVNTAVNERKIIEEDGKFYIYINHDSLFCSIRDDEMIMHNGWMLLEPMDLAVDEKKTYIDRIPRHRQSHDPLKGRIVHLGDQVEKYIFGSETDAGIYVKKGDIVIFLPNSDIPLEYHMHQSLDKKYYRVQRKELLSLYN